MIRRPCGIDKIADQWEVCRVRGEMGTDFETDATTPEAVGVGSPWSISDTNALICDAVAGSRSAA